MSTRHRDLIGVELHNAKVNLEAPTRVPRYAGETVFDGTNLWIANGTTADTWTRSAPTPPTPTVPDFFSWSLNLQSIFINTTGAAISLYYRTPVSGSTWALLRRYVAGTDIPVMNTNGVIAMNTWIEQRGKGLYMPLIVQANAAKLETRLSIRSLDPDSAVTISNVGRWAEPGTSRVYENAQAFNVTNCIAAFVGDVLQGE